MPNPIRQVQPADPIVRRRALIALISVAIAGALLGCALVLFAMAWRLSTYWG